MTSRNCIYHHPRIIFCWDAPRTLCTVILFMPVYRVNRYILLIGVQQFPEITEYIRNTHILNTVYVLTTAAVTSSRNISTISR